MMAVGRYIALLIVLLDVVAAQTTIANATVHAAFGSTVTLTCPFTVQQTSDAIMWRGANQISNNGDKLVNDQNVLLISAGNTWNLQIVSMNGNYDLGGSTFYICSREFTTSSGAVDVSSFSYDLVAYNRINSDAVNVPAAALQPIVEPTATQWSCTGKGFPQPQIQWYTQPNHPIDNTIEPLNPTVVQTPQVTVDSNTGEYTVTVVATIYAQRRDLFGVLGCNITQPAQRGLEIYYKDFSGLRMDVQHKPKCSATKPRKFGTTVNQPVTISCHVEDNPIDTIYTFKVESTAYEPTTTEIRSYTNTQDYTSVGEFSWTPRTETEYGLVTCTATNTIGTETCELEVLEPGLPEPPNGCDAYDVTSEGYRIYCYSGYDGGSTQKFNLDKYNGNGNFKTLKKDESEASFRVEKQQPNTTTSYRICSSNSAFSSVKVCTEILTFSTIDGPPTSTTDLWWLAILIPAVVILLILVGLLVFCCTKGSKKEVPAKDAERPDVGDEVATETSVEMHKSDPHNSQPEQRTSSGVHHSDSLPSRTSDAAF